MNNSVEEKDYFWFYIAGLVITLMAVLYVVRSGEHDKYETSRKAIVEDASNSAYRDTSAYKN